jgi:hypothetical protein
MRYGCRTRLRALIGATTPAVPETVPGFEALNINDQHGAGRNLAENSFGAPLLMQDLCYQYAVSLGVLQTVEAPVSTVSRTTGRSFSGASQTGPRRLSSTIC